MSIRMFGAAAIALSAAGLFMSFDAANGAAISVDRMTAKRVIHVDTIALPFDFRVENSADIVLGKVVRQRVDEDSMSFPCTVYTIEVSRSARGNSAATIDVMVGGSELARTPTIVPEAPRLEVGGEYVVSICRDPSTGVLGLLGLGSGVARVVDTDGSRVLRGQLATPDETIDGFFARVAAVLESQN